MTLLYTPGEPAGIGPDLILTAAAQGLDVPVLVIADPDMLEERARQLGLAVTLQETDSPTASPAGAGKLWVLPIGLRSAAVPGRLNPANSSYVLETLRRATELCLQHPASVALVTGPVHKGIINDAGIPFTGHTEFLAGLTGGHPVMMLACPGLRVALATTHLPLREVTDAITPARLEKVLRILHADLGKRFGIASPQILVCGLNPHAGEGGHLGHEEMEIIAPVLEKLRAAWRRLPPELPLAITIATTVALLLAVLLTSLLSSIPGFAWYHSLSIAVVLIFAMSAVAGRYMHFFRRGADEPRSERLG
ncbi:MAG: hypothetical protein DSZ00_09265, partial [Gammaproteobacteria bacterium]